MRFSPRLVILSALAVTCTSALPASAAPDAGASPGLARVAPSSRFSWPVTPHTVLRRFDPPEVKWGAGHRGVDLGTMAGVEVRAPGDGVVTFRGTVVDRGVITIRHPQGFDTTYEPVTDQLPVGTAVHRGDVIARLATSDHCDVPCLHWGVRPSKDAYRDPLTLVRGTHVVLLPPV